MPAIRDFHSFRLDSYKNDLCDLRVFCGEKIISGRLVKICSLTSLPDSVT